MQEFDPTGCTDGSNDRYPSSAGTTAGMLPSGAARIKCPKSLKL